MAPVELLVEKPAERIEERIERSVATERAIPRVVVQRSLTTAARIERSHEVVPTRQRYAVREDAPKKPLVDAVRQAQEDYGWRWKDGSLKPGPDVTPKFDSLYERARRGENILPADARHYSVVLKPGTADKLALGTYYVKALKALRDAGVQAVIGDGGGVRAPSANVQSAAQDIQDQAARTGLPVVFFGHSQGGSGGLDAARHNLSASDNLRAIVADRSPELGNPVASVVNEANAMQPMQKLGAAVFGADPKLSSQMSYAARKKELKDAPAVPVPVLTLSSGYDGHTSVFSIGSGLIGGAFSLASDGVVSEQDTWVPNAPRIHLEDTDHMASVSGLPIFSGKYRDQGAYILTLYRMILDIAREEDARKAAELAKAPPLSRVRLVPP